MSIDVQTEQQLEAIEEHQSEEGRQAAAEAGSTSQHRAPSRQQRVKNNQVGRQPHARKEHQIVKQADRRQPK